MSSVQDSGLDPSQNRNRRDLAIICGLLLAGIAAVTGIAWQSVQAMLSVWWNHSAYNHGLFIIPIAAYMAWERRGRLAGLVLEPFWPGIILVGGFAVGWLVARGASIMEGEQLAYVGMVQGLMLTLLGRKIFRAQILPISYLWLMVPTGGFLLPGLQAVATWLTQFFLSFTSIPFFVEGFYFQLPVGAFFIAPGCAGLNFILAALALSVVYAEMTYQGWRRKIICILSWVSIAILANGVRIFGILVIAEITDMKLAIVDDHLLYGWGFFFLILVGLMLFGQRFSNMPSSPSVLAGSDWMPAGAARPARAGAAALACILLSGVIVEYGRFVFSEGAPVQGLALSPQSGGGGWQVAENLESLVQYFPNADSRNVWRFENGGMGAGLFAAYYNAQWDGHEAVVDDRNIFYTGGSRVVGRAVHAPGLNGVPRQVTEEIVSRISGEILVWRWYCVGSHFTPRAFEVRIRTALNRLMMRENPVTVFTLFRETGASARDEMTSLMQALSTPDSGVNVTDAQGMLVRNVVCW